MSTSTTNTIRLHRVLRAAPEKIYRAFLDADAMAKWLPPNGFTGKVHQMDAKVGGTYKMSFTNFTTGKSHTFGGTYVELKPHERIRDTRTAAGRNLRSRRSPANFKTPIPTLPLMENTSTSPPIAPWRLAANASRITTFGSWTRRTQARHRTSPSDWRTGARRAIFQRRSTAIRIIFIRSP